MISRRKFLAAGALALPFISRGATKPALSIGLVADPQFADIPPIGTRHYRQSIGKLTEAVEHFNGQELDFCVNAGDFIDRFWASFDEISKPLAKSRHKFHHLLGNHDFDLLDSFKSRVPERLGMPQRYYSVMRPGFCFAMLDTTDVSPYSHPKDSPETAEANARLMEYAAKRAPNAQSWNGALSDRQLAWFEETCKTAAAQNQKVIAFAHHPILPAAIHTAWNSDAVLRIIERNKNVVAWFNGHNHAGDFAIHHQVPCTTLKGMVETPDTNAYSVARIFEDRLELTGHDREPSRELRFRLP
jgi:manganese-dependent ADP-ribose/CDP-alcohol diphosphatase